jgi:F-type H+-transporting ATPase subunit gamma
MATLREVRSRISGVQKTQKITRAMKMVAAAKLRRRQMAVVAARPYARKMKELLATLSTAPEAAAADLLITREVAAVALVVVTSDRGFCGAFNGNLLKAAVAHVGSLPEEGGAGKPLRLFCIGKKGADFFTKRGYAVAARHVGVFTPLEFPRAQSIAREVVEGYRRGDFDRVDLVYNEFKSVAQQRIMIEQFLPVPPEDTPGATRRAIDYIYEPGRREILFSLIPRHLDFQLWKALLESSAAEEGARMAAMENATENASEMITGLRLQYNKARQAAITKELLEVVSGAEALLQAE